MEIKIVADSITKTEIDEIAKNQFGDFVKAVVDVAEGIMVVGGELHADGEAVLMERGSKQEDLWGINFYLGKSPSEWIQFDSMINVRPSSGNRSREVENPEIKEMILGVIKKLVIQK